MENKKLLFIVDSFYPEYSPNTACCENIMEECKKDGYSVDIVSFYFEENGFVPYSEIGDTKVFKISAYKTFFKKLVDKYGVKHWTQLPWYLSFFIATYYRIKARFVKRSDERKFLVNYEDLRENIKSHTNEAYDYIISFSIPFSSHVIAKRLVKDGIAKKWSAVCFDSYEYNPIYQTWRVKDKIKTAKKTFRSAEKVFMIPGVAEENIRHNFIPSYADKIITIPIPSLKEQKNEETNTSEKINLVFCGNFYETLRNPEKFLQAFSCLSEEFCLKLFGEGCEETVERESKNFTKCQIQINGKVTHKQALKELGKANILINIGNANTTLVPSKLLEVFGFAKPVINCYFSKDDICLKICENYPLAYNFNLSEYGKEDIEDLIRFCEENKNKASTYEEVTKNLTENKIENVYKKIFSNTTLNS